jgi:hypothetical protein
MLGEDANSTKLLTRKLEGTNHSESVSITRISVWNLSFKERSASSTGCVQDPGTECWKEDNECR